MLRYSQWTVPRISGMESARPPEQRYYVSSRSLSKKLWASRVSSVVNKEVKEEEVNILGSYLPPGLMSAT